MSYQLMLDFVGMFVVVRNSNSGRISIGCLDEPGHIHTIHYFDGSGTNIAALRSPELLIATEPLSDTLLEANDRLPDVAGFGGGAKPLADVYGEFSTRFDLLGGSLVALPAHIGDNQSRWKMPVATGTFHLTDRMRFTGQVSDDRLKLGEVILAAENGRIHGIVSAIDGDYGRRTRELEIGLPLTEFALFYNLTRTYGQIPIAAPITAANPNEPICPIGFIEVS
jgi:hypothetical protein